MFEFIAAVSVSLLISMLITLWTNERKQRIRAEEDAVMMCAGLRHWRKIAEDTPTRHAAQVMALQQEIDTLKLDAHATGDAGQGVRMQ